jgi:hypothetical protein
MVAAVEAGVVRTGDDLGSFIAASWRESGRAAWREAVAACDGGVLCLGDSQVKCGLLPDVLRRRLGLGAVNLAVVGGQAPSTYHLLERVLSAGARPRAVVVDFYPSLLAADLTINTRNWPELLGLWGCLRLVTGVRDARLAAPLLVRAALPSLRAREEVRAAVVAALSGTDDEGRARARAYRRNWRLNGGAHALAVRPGGGDVPADPVDPAAAARWRAKPENARYVRRTLALAAAHGIPVFWLLPTYAPSLQAARRHDALGAAHLRFTRAAQAAFPGVTVLDPSRVIADPLLFSDPCHVDRRGAVALSLAVAEALAVALNPAAPVPGEGRRWVELSPTVPRSAWVATAEAGIEDVAQSAESLRAGDGAARVAAGAETTRRR